MTRAPPRDGLFNFSTPSPNPTLPESAECRAAEDCVDLGAELGAEALAAEALGVRADGGGVEARLGRLECPHGGRERLGRLLGEEEARRRAARRRAERDHGLRRAAAPERDH